jgi:hypothetical protein
MRIIKIVSEMERTHKILAAMYFTAGLLIGLSVGAEVKADDMPVAPFVSGELLQNLDPQTDWYAGGKQTKGTGNVKAGVEVGITENVTASIFVYHESMSNFGEDYGHNGVGVGLKAGGL